MPRGGQGQSIATIDKERCLSSALAIGMQIANTKFGGRGYRYWHFDANAGSGFNEKVGVPGSPIVALIGADEYLAGMRLDAVFCDRDGEAMAALQQRIQENQKWAKASTLLTADNEDGLKLFAERIRRSGEKPEYAIGFALADPNGYWFRNKDGDGPPIEGLTRLTREFPRIDIGLNLNTRIYRLQKPHGHVVQEPLAVLGSLNKKHWLVRRTQHGGNEYLLAVGRNVPTDGHSAMGFHKLASPAGQEIINIVSGGRQFDLFKGVTPNIEVTYGAGHGKSSTV